MKVRKSLPEAARASSLVAEAPTAASRAQGGQPREKPSDPTGEAHAVEASEVVQEDPQKVSRGIRSVGVYLAGAVWILTLVGLI
jgi:hypothetical protein